MMKDNCHPALSESFCARALLGMLFFLVFSTSAQALQTLVLNTSRINQLQCTYNEDEDSYTFKTTGNDPYIFVNALSQALSEEEVILCFEYKCSRTLGDFQVYYGNSYSEARSRVLGNLILSKEWKKKEFNIKNDRKSFGWGTAGQTMRLDFGMASGYTITIRNLCIHAEGEEELDEKTIESRLAASYLNTEYPLQIGQVEVKRASVSVSCSVPDDGNSYSLVEIPLFRNVDDIDEADMLMPLVPGDTAVVLTRVKRMDAIYYDRIVSRWALVKTLDDGTHKLVSHARYADQVPSLASPVPMPLKSKKGLGGFYINENLSDLDDLQIGSVTVNVVANNLISTSAGTFGSNSISHKYATNTFYFDRGQIEYYDRVMKECYKRGIVTSVILLFVPTPVSAKETVHPEFSGGYYSMPNMTTAKGTVLYAAIIDFLAKRYSGSTYGRINNWIMHNEVDYGLTWTNMGQQPMPRYMDAYVKSMRLVYNIARQYDPNTSVLASFTHSWTQDSNEDGAGYNTKRMLEQINRYSRAEGDFFWGLAYHPYPQDLTKPAFWKNDTRSTYKMDSPYCTFKNLEVVNAWVLDPENRYMGTVKRPLHLSENGTNSPDYSTTQLNLQAAGACWAWKKVARLEGIDGMQWHNWRDNREEFGLCIGLRYYPDDENHPNGCKPVWYVWQAAGTEQEEDVFAPYLGVLGVKSWDNIFGGTLLGVEQPVAEGVEDMDADAAIYTLDGIRRGLLSDLDHLPAGVYVVRGKHSARKVVKK